MAIALFVLVRVEDRFVDGYQGVQGGSAVIVVVGYLEREVP
ncbi:hypothetical protein [Rhodococcus qingshengii]|nr:hypothetical protein [Rhodococcus qingshengii]